MDNWDRYICINYFCPSHFTRQICKQYRFIQCGLFCCLWPTGWAYLQISKGNLLWNLLLGDISSFFRPNSGKKSTLTKSIIQKNRCIQRICQQVKYGVHRSATKLEWCVPRKSPSEHFTASASHPRNLLEARSILANRMRLLRCKYHQFNFIQSLQ